MDMSELSKNQFCISEDLNSEFERLVCVKSQGTMVIDIEVLAARWLAEFGPSTNVPIEFSFPRLSFGVNAIARLRGALRRFS